MNLLQMSISGGVMILVIAAVRALGHRRLPKAVFPALWAVAVLRLLLPFSIPSPTSVYTYAPAYVPVRTVQTGPAFPPLQPVNPDAVFVEAPVAVSPWTVVWAVGLGLCLLYFVIGYLRTHRELRSACPVESEAIRNILHAFPLRRTVTVRQSDRAAVPMTYGLLRPVILLPAGLAQTDDETLAYVLTHELTHIRRFDGVFKLLLALAFCIHWFNPAVWLLFTLCNRDIELSCDEAVVRRLPGDPRAGYAKALIALEAEKSGLSPLYNSFSKTAIEARIQAIMQYKKATAAAALCALVLIIGVTAVFATSAKERAQTDGTQLGMSPAFEPTRENILEEYGPYGIRFDKEGNMRYDGYTVRYFWDGYELTDGGEPFIRATRYEYANPKGFADIRTVREKIQNDDGSIDNMGPILKVERYVEENFDLYAGQDGPQMATAEGGDGIGGTSFEEIFSRYADFGITYEPRPEGSGRGNVYFNGELVGLFVDQAYGNRDGIFTYESVDKSSLTAYTVRDRNGVVEIQTEENLDTSAALENKANLESRRNFQTSMSRYTPFGLAVTYNPPGPGVILKSMEYQGHSVVSLLDEMGLVLYGEFGRDRSAYPEDAVRLRVVYDGDALTDISGLEIMSDAKFEEWEQQAFPDRS